MNEIAPAAPCQYFLACNHLFQTPGPVREIEKIVEVPVERIVEMEKIIEVPVEIEKIIEVPVEVEKIVEVPVEVERVVEKLVEVALPFNSNPGAQTGPNPVVARKETSRPVDSSRGIPPPFTFPQCNHPTSGGFRPSEQLLFTSMSLYQPMPSWGACRRGQSPQPPLPP